MKKIIPVIFVLSVASGLAGAEPNAPEYPLSVYKMPAAWPRHQQIRQAFIAAVQSGNIKGMEQCARAGIQAMPGDATWHYNLACALAYRADAVEALNELEKAIDFGFRDAKAIAADNDFIRIRALPRFKQLVEKARKLSGQPVWGRPPAQLPAYGTYGGNITLTETNLVFDFEAGILSAAIKLSGSPSASAQAVHYQGPNREMLVPWLSEGTAVGNAGDLTMNRDRAHALLNAGKFPLLTRIAYDKIGVAAGADINFPNLIVPGHAVFGNASRAILSGPYWRSLPRKAMTQSDLLMRLSTLYAANQFWVFPAHMDFGKPELGDVFPGNLPCCLISVGSSWSDLPFLEAALAASASFARPTKESLLARGLLGPTLQWLFRRSHKGVRTESEYLSPLAHPVAWRAGDLDVAAMCDRAHTLRPEAIPPAVSFQFVNSKFFPVRFPAPGIDYADACPEFLYVTPFAAACILRDTEAERTFLVQAQALPTPEEGKRAEFTWCVIGGDPGRVKIEAPLGEKIEGPSTGLAQLTVNRRGLTNRLDVAVFARLPGTSFGAPAIMSFSPVALETRVWREDGKIESIDYSNPRKVYCDPKIALSRAWKDVYRYDESGKMLGFTRFYPGKEGIEFARPDQRVTWKKPDGTPAKVVHVQYVPRGTGIPDQPPELTYVDDGDPVRYNAR